MGTSHTTQHSPPLTGYDTGNMWTHDFLSGDDITDWIAVRRHVHWHWLTRTARGARKCSISDWNSCSGRDLYSSFGGGGPQGWSMRYSVLLENPTGMGLLQYCAYLSHFKLHPSNCFTVRNSEIWGQWSVTDDRSESVSMLVGQPFAR